MKGFVMRLFDPSVHHLEGEQPADKRWTRCKRPIVVVGGEVTIEFFPINAIVDRNETPEAVMAGVLSGDLNSVAYFTGRNPAFAIMGDLIAGYDSPEQVQTFHDVAVAHGGVSVEDAPGPRTGASGTMYLAYVRDPDGNKICAIHRPA